jgi:deoxyribonuclease V
VLACIDVSYRDDVAHAGCLLFRTWADATPAQEVLAITSPIAPYSPGEFFRRELPPILDLLARIDVPLETIIVDGYVWLAGQGPGLGAHLYAALRESIPIVGVAKTAWTRAADARAPATHAMVPVVRGTSTRPLFVTSVGIDVTESAALVARMHGPHRLPTLLKAVDRLVREAQ